MALDKTGTLSEGHFRVTDMLAVDGVTNVQHILHWYALEDIYPINYSTLWLRLTFVYLSTTFQSLE